MKLTSKHLLPLLVCTSISLCIVTLPLSAHAKFRGGSVQDTSVIRALENELEYIKNVVNIKEDITAMQRELSRTLDVSSFFANLKQNFLSTINSTYRQGIFTYDNPLNVLEEQIGNYKAVYTNESLSKSNAYNTKLADKTDIAALDRITQLLYHSTSIVNDAIRINGTIDETGTMSASQKAILLESTHAEQQIDSTAIKINQTMSNLIQENTMRERQRDTQKAVPYFENPEDTAVQQRRNDELEKMGIRNHKLPSFTTD